MSNTLDDLLKKYIKDSLKIEPYIACDLDGTLAEYTTFKGDDHIGPPVEAMRKRVMEHVANGEKVKIFTARALLPENIPIVKKWLKDNGFPDFEVTNIKDHGMTTLYDDRAVRIIKNTGMSCCEKE